TALCSTGPSLPLHVGRRLHGTVKSSALWATSIEFLNDSSEFQYGKAVIEAAIDDRLKSLDRDVKSDFVKRDFLSLARRTFADKWQDFFVTCFCEEGNLLSQWRGYGKGGGGYSIGFERCLLGTRSPEGTSLRKVIYDSHRQKQWAETLIDKTLELVTWEAWD